MARYAYERLSAQDASFLWAEKTNQPMHVGALAILDAEQLQHPDGRLDIDRYRQAVESVLHWIPRYRQKLDWIPVERWPVWIDDRSFDLGYHIRHIALPKPGGLDQLKELAGRIHSRPLDRNHPLWEIWVIEGVEGGAQFALLNKIHHCMIDGASGADLSQILLSPSPRVDLAEPLPYMPRPAPTRAELFRDSVGLATRRNLGLVRSIASALRDGRSEDEPGLERRLRAFREMLGFLLRPASETPINGPLGPRRRIEWSTMPLDDVRELGRVLECTVNDVVLATVTGAMRRYLFRRRVDSRKLDFRVAAPVSTRREEHDRRQGNHVSTWIVPLPLGLDDPIARLEEIRRRTAELKQNDAALALDTLMQVAEWLPSALIERSTRLVTGPANMIVTNVPGPQFPLYVVGARLLGLYPLVPLLPGGGLGIALFSYEGKLCWGFNGDGELVPDLRLFADDMKTAFEELRGAAVSSYVERRTAPAETPAAPEAPDPAEGVSDPASDSAEPAEGVRASTMKSRPRNARRSGTKRRSAASGEGRLAAADPR